MKTRMLILEDGTIFEGTAFGSDHASMGQTVFTTAMTGYQEIITNPSNSGAIICMTYPLIGNYGINREDFESIVPTMKGIVVRELSDEPSNFRSAMSLGQLLEMTDIPGIEGIDTRKLTRILRDKGPQRGTLTAANEEINVEEVVASLQAYELPTDLVSRVSTKKAYPNPGRGERVVIIDYGMKHGILRELNNRDCDIIVVPHDFQADEVLSLFPDGVVLSNGPGNPADIENVLETIQALLGTVPIFGIGLGHQLLAMACGATVVKMKTDNRGGNHPVKDLLTGRTELTSQNHGYVVDEATLDDTGLTVTHRGLNDNTVQGLRSEHFPAFSVQFYPEAAPGPEDASHLYGDFMNLIHQHSGEEPSNA